MEDKLFAKCLLTDDEIAHVIFESNKTCKAVRHEVNKAQLTKAIPIIRKAVEAETHKEHISAMVDEGNDAYKRGVAKTQREIGEWGNSICFDHDKMHIIYKHQCEKCWESGTWRSK